MRKEPRPHQTETLAMLRASLGMGKRRPMIQMPTGAGKTLFAAMLIDGAMRKNKRVIFVVPAISLIDQTVERFGEEGICDVGVIQANHHLTNYDMPVQVASVQTLMRRDVPLADMVIIDEAHVCFEFVIEWMLRDEWLRVPFIGLSATPWTKGLGKHYDDLIVGVTMQQLIEQGYLSPFRVFAMAHPDLTGVKSVGGDYHEGQLAEVMAEGGLVAGVVTTWLRRGEGRPTLCFAVDRAHAKKLQQEFIGAGVECGYIDAYTEPLERRQVQEAFESGHLRVVCNVGCLTTGVDWDVRCIILARPTKSEMLFVQMVGRGLRTAHFKKDCLVFDHADNTLRLGFVSDIHKPQLCDGKKKAASDSKKEPLPKECSECQYLKPPKVGKCPNCGFKPERVSDVFETDDELVEVGAAGKTQFDMFEKQRWYSGLLYIQHQRGYRKGWAANQYRNIFKVWPAHQLRECSEPPTEEIASYVKSQMIRFAKRKLA